MSNEEPITIERLLEDQERANNDSDYEEHIVFEPQLIAGTRYKFKLNEVPMK